MKKTSKFLLCLAIFLSPCSLVSRVYGQADTSAQQVSASQYCDFLNHVATSDSHHLYDEAMGSDPYTACIARVGMPGRYCYFVLAGKETSPITYVNWLDEARYCNWLENGEPTAEQDSTCTETGAYTLDDAADSKRDDFFLGKVLKNPEAIYFICDDENSGNVLKSNWRGFEVVTPSIATLTLTGSSTSLSPSERNISGLLVDAGVAIFAVGCMMTGDAPLERETTEVSSQVNSGLSEDSASIAREERSHSIAEENSNITPSSDAYKKTVSLWKNINDAKNNALNLNNEDLFKNAWADVIQIVATAETACNELEAVDSRFKNYVSHKMQYWKETSAIASLWSDSFKKQNFLRIAREKAQADFKNLDALAEAKQKEADAESSWTQLSQAYSDARTSIPKMEQADWDIGHAAAQSWEIYHMTESFWYEALKAEKMAKEAENKALANKSHDRGKFEEDWNEAHQKINQVKKEWNNVIEFYTDARDIIPEEKQAEWDDKLTMAKETWDTNIKKAQYFNIEYTLRPQLLEVQKIQKIADIAKEKARISSLAHEEATQKAVFAKSAWKELIKTYTDAKKTIPLSKQDDWEVLINDLKKEQYNHLLHQILPPGALSNNNADCFINSSLQLCKTLQIAKVNEMPTFSRFLNDDLGSDQDCRTLRSEIASNVLKDDNDLKAVVVDGVAQTHEDAAAFLRLLLEKVNAPKVLFEEVLINKNTGEQKTIAVTESKTILELTLPEVGEGRCATMQQIIDHYLTSSTQGYHWIEGDPTSSTLVTKISKLKEPVPSTLVVAVGRFNGHLLKRKDPIAEFDEIITLPTTGGKTIFYQPKAMICHIGDSLENGHYVCYRVEHGNWLLFDDDKAVGTQGTKADAMYVGQNCYVIAYQKIEPPDDIAEAIKENTIPATEAVNDALMAARLHACEVFEEKYFEKIQAAKKAKDAYDNLVELYNEFSDTQKAPFGGDHTVEQAKYNQALWTARVFSTEAEKAEEIAEFTKRICAQVNPKDCENVWSEAINASKIAEQAWDEVTNKVTEAISIAAERSNFLERGENWEDAFENALKEKSDWADKVASLIERKWYRRDHEDCVP